MAVFPKLIFKLLECVLSQLLPNSFHKAAKKFKQHGFFFFLFKSSPPSSSSSLKTPHQSSNFFFPHLSKCCLQNRASQTLVSDFSTSLLRNNNNKSHSFSFFFPYFMLVAFEGGSLFRALILLLSCPILCLLDWESNFKAMIFISFCGLPIKSMANVSSTVLPKFYLENLDLLVFEAFQAFGSRLVFTTVPRVMVEAFLTNYLNVDHVLGSELQTYGKFYTGFLSEKGLLLKHKALVEYFGQERPDVVGIGAPNLHDHLFISHCKVS